MEHLEETALGTALTPPDYGAQICGRHFCDLVESHEHLNTQHRNIKFTVEHEKENKLAFLDVQVIRTNNRLTTRPLT